MLFLVFLLFIAGGLINAKDLPLAYRHFWLYIFPIPFLYFFAKIVFEEKYAVLILRCICMMATLVAMYGLIEFVNGENLIYSHYNNIYYNIYKGYRMMSTHIHPAPLGTYLAAIFPLSMALCMMEKSKFIKVVFIICAVVIFTGAIFTFSRGTLLALCIEMLILTFYTFARHRKQWRAQYSARGNPGIGSTSLPSLELSRAKSMDSQHGLHLKEKKKIVYICLALFPVLLIAINSLLQNISESAFRYAFNDLIRMDNYSRKFTRFIGAGRMVMDHPFFGVGFGHFRVLFDQYFPSIASITEYDKKIADCMYLTVLAETGIIGFVGFVLFVYFIFKNAYRALKVKLGNQDWFLLLGFFSGFIGIMCTFLTYDTLYWTAPSCLFWSYAGILSYLSAKKCL
jgi:hypothetical protein